jgi:hypothetical protein
MVKLAAGKSADDVVESFHGDMSTPPPIDGEFGSIPHIAKGMITPFTVTSS